jgi:hypothetical protein
LITEKLFIAFIFSTPGVIGTLLALAGALIGE